MKTGEVWWTMPSIHRRTYSIIDEEPTDIASEAEMDSLIERFAEIQERYRGACTPEETNSCTTIPMPIVSANPVYHYDACTDEEACDEPEEGLTVERMRRMRADMMGGMPPPQAIWYGEEASTPPEPPKWKCVNKDREKVMF